MSGEYESNRYNKTNKRVEWKEKREIALKVRTSIIRQ